MNKNLKFFNYLLINSKFNKGKLIIRNLLIDKDHFQYCETPNYYTEIDIGYKIINKQRIKVKLVQDTSGLKIFDLKDYKFI